jgi:hypothetical protein
LYSPELVAQLGKDYTVYAHDYSEYEAPLVGQGMISRVLASSSPTSEAPAHQSKRMANGRVCRIPLDLFSKGVQETLEVKLQLVPVPTVMQSGYLDSMQKYREFRNVIPVDFNAQSRTNFVHENTALLESHDGSPMNQSEIETFQQLLSESSSPRKFNSFPPIKSVRLVSPLQSSFAHSRVSTSGGSRTPAHHLRQSKQSIPRSDMIRSSSRAAMRDSDFQTQVS